MHNDIFHFYVDGGSIEEPNIVDEEAVEEDNAVEAPLLVDPQAEKENTPTLGQFSKFLVERVLMQGRHGTIDILQLG
jgi:hypothetical protein